MRYTEYLRTSVLLLGTSSFALIVVSVGAIAREHSVLLLVFGAIWLVIACLIGTWLGHSDQVMESIRDLLSRSRPEPVFPKIEPAAVLFTRLWPVLAIAIISAIASLLFPQLAVAAAGYGLLWSLAWRKQALAVEAIEERDAVHFWIVRTKAFSKPKLVRVPAM
ncbi:MAG: hypothetical protein ACRDKI_06075 [Solirubrobacterales bacterium]